jgi:hypothetical protein
MPLPNLAKRPCPLRKRPALKPAPLIKSRYFLNPIQGNTYPSVFYQVGWFKRFPRYLSHQLFGPITLAVAMDILPQPPQKLFKLPIRKLLIKISDILFGLGEKLRGIKVPQRISRKITD